MYFQRMKITPIQQFQTGHKIQGFYLCTEKNIRNTKNGDVYLDLVLVDKTGSVRAKVWDKVEYFSKQFDIGHPVAVKGIVSDYNSQTQLTVSNIKHISDDSYDKYGYSTDLLAPQIEHDIDHLWKEIQSFIQSLKRPYKHLCKKIFTQYEDSIKQIPASVHHHHQVKGGFLLHTVNVCKIAQSIIELYPTLNSDLVCAGLLLHDIGKVKSMTGDLINDYTDSGRLIGHSVLGRDILIEACSKSNVLEDVQSKLEHIILSHQGNIENGSVIEPKFPEALLIHHIDNMDARLTQMIEIIENDPNSDWTDTRNPFHRQLFKG